MIYKVRYEQLAEKKLNKLDSSVRKRIVGWVERNLEGCENPRAHGHALTGNLSDFWRYRVGNWRIMAKILDGELIILVINVDKRNDIYK